MALAPNREHNHHEQEEGGAACARMPGYGERNLRHEQPSRKGCLAFLSGRLHGWALHGYQSVLTGPGHDRIVAAEIIVIPRPGVHRRKTGAVGVGD